MHLYVFSKGVLCGFFFPFYKYMQWLTSVAVKSMILVSDMNIIIDHMEVFSKC